MGRSSEEQASARKPKAPASARVEIGPQPLVSLTPAGRLHLAAAAAELALAPATRARLVETFARGEGHALLRLGLGELATELPAELVYFRELARMFLTAACANPELEALREQIRVPPPLADLQRLVDAAPPLPGSEYLDLALLERLWTELEAALQAELGQWKGSVQEYLHAQSPVWNLVGRVCFHLAENKRDEEHPFAFLATYARGSRPAPRCSTCRSARRCDESGAQGRPRRSARRCCVPGREGRPAERIFARAGRLAAICFSRSRGRRGRRIAS